MTADTLCGTREWERAADFLQRRINDYPADYRLRYLLAVALEEASRTNEAVQQFLQLLSDQEELPTKKKSAPSQMPQMGSYYDMIRQIMPADAVEWLQLAQYRYSAYAYRQQQSYGAPVIRSVAGGMQRSAVQIPSSIDNVRPMAVSHLLSIAATLDDDKLDDVCKELESCGIKQAKVLSRLDPNRQDFAAILPDILDKDPDNETALALMAVQSMGIRTDALSPYCAKAFEKFRNNRPQLAFMAAVQAGIAAARTAGTDESDANNGEDAASNKYLDEALKIGATFDHPNPMIVMSLTMVLGGRNIGGQDAEIGDTYRQKFSQLMIQWYPELSKSPQYGSWTFYYAAQSLVKNSDPASYMRFLDDEVARWQQGALGGRAGVITAQMAYGRQPRLLPSASFPPMQLSDFPPNVLALFAANQDPNYSPYGNQTATFDEDTAKKVGPLLEKVTSPILRILFAHKAELPDRIDAELKTLLAAKSPVLDAYLLAASLAAEKENHAEAVKLLETSQYLPMKQDVRQQVDAAIVASVLTLKQKSAAIDEHLLDVGQKASLRLRRARLDGQQRTELIAAMEELGLKKEADKLDSLAAASNTPRSNLSPAVAYSGPASRTGSDQIAKLIGQGKRDAAARQLANDVTAQVRQLLANPQNASYYRRQMFRQVRQQIDGNGLTDDVLKLLDPGDSKNVQKFVDYGIACDLLGRPQAARTALEQAVTLRPKDDAARMQLILLITTEDPPSAAKQLTHISKSGRGAFGQMIAGRLQDWESSFEERIGFARLAVEYLKVLEPGDVAQAYWIDNLMTMIGRQMSGRRGGLPSLYAVNPSERSQSANQAEIMTERRKVHDALCEQMLSMPELARIGFRHLLAATQAQNKPVDAFAEHAVRILTSEADAKPNRPAVRQTTYYVNGESEVRFRGPEEFLARRAWKSGEWNEIDETLLPKLAGDKNRQARERLTQLASLYRCDEAQFSGEAEKAVKHFRPLQPGQANEGLAIAVDVWADRGLKVDLQPLIIKQLKLDSTAQNSYQAPGYVVRYIEGTAQQSDRERQLAFLEEVAAVYLGPAEKRNDFLKKNYNPRQINWGTPNGRIHVFGQLMEQLCQRSELLFIVLEHLEQFDEPKPVQNFEYRVGEAIQKLEPMGAEASMDLLRRSPWLADLEHFRPLVVGGRGTASPLVLLLRQQSKTAESNAKLRELVQAEQTQGGKTFGGGLVLAALEQEKTSTALLDYVGGQLEAIRKLPDRQQQSLAALLRELVNSDAIKQKDLNGAAKAAQEWILGSYAEQAQSLLARAEKAKRLEELGITNSQVDSFFRQNLAELIGGDGASAAPVFLRVCELCREAQRRGEWHMYFGNGESLEGFVLNQSSHAVQPYDWPMFRFVVDVVNTSGKRQVEAGYAVANIARGAIQTGGGRVPKASDGKATPIEDQVHAIYEELGAVLKERPSSLFIVPFYEQVHSELENPASNEKLRAWAEKEMSGGKYPELASNMHAVLALVAEERDPTGKQNGVKTRREMSDYHKRFGAIVHDEKLSLTWRVYVAAFIADRQSVRLPLELARDLVALYTQALNADVPITNNQNRSLTQCVLSLAHESESEKLLNEWRDAWQRRYLGQPARQASGPRQFENLNRLTDSSALGRALEVYVANESPQLPDGAKRLLAVYDDQIGHLPTAYAILLRSHHPEEAAQLLRGHVLKLDVDWPNIEETRYDTAIESLLPTMLEKLERDDERYLAQVLFAAMPDEGQPNDDKEGTVKPTARDERLSQLAGKFAHAPFRDATVKKLCLVLLSGSDSAGKLVAGDVAAAYDASAILSAAGGPDRTRLKFESRLAQCHFRHLLREGKVEPLIDLLKRLSANPSDDDYQFGETVSPLIECVCDEIADAQRVKWSADACLSLGESLGNTLKGREYVNINIFEKFGTTLVALYCQAGKGEDLKTLREKLSNYNRSRMENSGLRDDVWSAGLVLNGPASPETRESRLRFLQNVLRYAFDQKWIERNGSPYRMRGQSERNFLSNVVKARLLSPDELKTHGLKALDGIGSQDEPAYAKAALANWLQSQKDYEKAAEVWRSMITFSANAKQVSRNEANYILGLATSLKNLARYDEALKALSMLEGKEFDQSLKVSYDQYKRDIETAKKNAAKPAANEPADGKSTRTAPADRSPNPAMLAVALPTLAV
ncbi:MAG: hypothetical protein IT427_14930 [Pirellulales bacterium]|nr:hypothetical protein [Pirellulales bacterium]